MKKFLSTGLITLVCIGICISAITASAGKPYRAHLTGASENPPVDTRATGNAMFTVNADSTEIAFRLVVANIHNATAAHIHFGAVGVNGPVVVGLFSGGSSGRSAGVLAEGTITSSDLVGPLAGMSLDDLIELIEDGDAYVNVHTTAYPGGEIRGQVE